VGIQYAALSAAGLHVVPALRRLSSVEYAFVDALPKNVCACDRPARRGSAIGSSEAVWLNRQLLKKLFPCSIGAGAANANGTARAASARTETMRLIRPDYTTRQPLVPGYRHEMTSVLSRPVRDHCLAPGRAGGAEIYAGRYGRLFPELPPLALESEFLRVLGRRGGACDGGLGVEGESADAREAAGWPIFGQFIAHDITADRSPVTHQAEPERIRNYRTPRANLESIYAGGPVGSPYLFDRADDAKLLLGEDGNDVPRNSQGVALIGDPRNDVHLFMSQLHVVWLKLHNLLVDRLREDGADAAALFEEARRAATWHYQWVILFDFLPRAVGRELVDELVAKGPTYFVPDGPEPFIPFEF